MTTTTAPPDLELAAVLDRAAQIIDTNGLNRERFFGQDSYVYEPGMPCCTVAAVGVALGLRYTFQLAEQLEADINIDMPRHPALRAIARHENLRTLRALYEWSDTTDQAEVVAALQDCAAGLRGEVTGWLDTVGAS